MQWPSEPSAWNETAQKAGWKAKGLNPVTKHQIRAFLTYRSIYNLRRSKIRSNAKDDLMANWDVHTIGSIAAGLKGWAGLNRTEAKHVIYCIIEIIQDDTRE